MADFTTHDVVIVGAGMAGLAAALKPKDRDLLVLESEPEVGGRTLSGKWRSHWANLSAQAIASDEKFHVTAVAEEVSRSLQTADDHAYRGSFYPLQGVGQPEDVAAAVVFFASDEAEWISGQIMVVAGGTPAASDVFRFLREVKPRPKGYD